MKFKAHRVGERICQAKCPCSLSSSKRQESYAAGSSAMNKDTKPYDFRWTAQVLAHFCVSCRAAKQCFNCQKNCLVHCSSLNKKLCDQSTDAGNTPQVNNVFEVNNDDLVELYRIEEPETKKQKLDMIKI